MRTMNRSMNLMIGVGLWVGLVAHGQDADQAAWLKHNVGKWKAELKMWPQGEEGEPILFEATETNEMMGTNWIIAKFTGEFGGQSFQGHGVYGFDAKRDCFVATWVDSANGFMSQYEGKYDASTKSVELTGKEIDPNSGELVEGKQVRSIKDENTRVVVSYQKPEGGGDFVKVMEITFTRHE